MEIVQPLSLEETKVYIYAIDFSMIINKMVEYDQWLEKDALDTCKQYRNFLFLNKKHDPANIQLPPSEDIDMFWHNHILDTEKYHKDCAAIFGRYIHHYPYFGIDSTSTKDDLNSAFDTMQELYFKEFGEYIYPTRSKRFKFVNSFLSRLNLRSFKQKKLSAF